MDVGMARRRRAEFRYSKIGSPTDEKITLIRTFVSENAAQRMWIPKTLGYDLRNRYKAVGPMVIVNASMGSTSIVDAANLFDALSHPRRLRAVRILDRADTALALKDLAVEIVRSKRTETAAEVDKEQAERVHVSLHHRHVPRLSDAGLVEYDATDDRVALAESAPKDVLDVLDR